MAKSAISYHHNIFSERLWPTGYWKEAQAPRPLDFRRSSATAWDGGGCGLRLRAGGFLATNYSSAFYSSDQRRTFLFSSAQAFTVCLARISFCASCPANRETRAGSHSFTCSVPAPRQLLSGGPEDLPAAVPGSPRCVPARDAAQAGEGNN